MYGSRLFDKRNNIHHMFLLLQFIHNIWVLIWQVFITGELTISIDNYLINEPEKIIE